MSDIGDSSKSDFHDQRDDVLLFDTGDDSDVGNGAYTIDTHFLWEDMGNYFWHRDIFTGIIGREDGTECLSNIVDINGREDGTEGLSNIVDINEQFFGKRHCTGDCEWDQ